MERSSSVKSFYSDVISLNGKSRYYIKNEEQLGDCLLIIGCCSQLSFFVQAVTAEQVAVNFGINERFEVMFTFIYAFKILPRLLNMMFLRVFSYWFRVLIAIVFLAASSLILVISYAEQEEFFGDESTPGFMYWNVVAFVLCAIGTGLSDAVIVG